MPITKKQFFSIFFKGIYSLFLGVGFIAVITLIVSFYSEVKNPDILQKQTAQYIAFPENEVMLDEMAVKLAREGQALSNIAPAAGGNSEAVSAEINKAQTDKAAAKEAAAE